MTFFSNQGSIFFALIPPSRIPKVKERLQACPIHPFAIIFNRDMKYGFSILLDNIKQESDIFRLGVISITDSFANYI